VWGKINAYRILVGKPLRKWPLGRRGTTILLIYKVFNDAVSTAEVI
jgi:hypothetical protein